MIRRPASASAARAYRENGRFEVDRIDAIEREVKSGYWFVIDAEVDLVFRKSTDGMWEELVRRSASGV